MIRGLQFFPLTYQEREEIFMMVETAEEQIKTVASKGGTTERALASLANEDFDAIIKRAMQACTDRADELSRG